MTILKEGEFCSCYECMLCHYTKKKKLKEMNEMTQKMVQIGSILKS